MKVQDLAQKLVETLGQSRSCLVAFSGGVDSAVVAKAAYMALNTKSIAVTAVSSSLASGERKVAERIAAAIGIRHEVIFTDELSDPMYVANQSTRCWHCKDELYSRLRQKGAELGFDTIANGTIVEDLGDFRPGLQAAEQHGVVSPLVECGIDKPRVRELAAFWDLEVWDKPASPCLSSRIVYGLEITPERLARIDAAEVLLKELGFPVVRVRCHQDDLARIEVPIDQIPRLVEPEVRKRLSGRLRALGFRFVTLDIEGFRSGNLNQVVQVQLSERPPAD